MNLNDEQHMAIQNVNKEAERGTVQGYLVLTMTSGRPAVDCHGEFSSLFKALFDASVANAPIKEVVLATAQALQGYDRLQAGKPNPA